MLISGIIIVVIGFISMITGLSLEGEPIDIYPVSFRGGMHYVFLICGILLLRFTSENLYMLKSWPYLISIAFVCVIVLIKKLFKDKKDASATMHV